MDMREILQRIDACKARLAISDRQISLSAKMSAEGIRNWRRRVANGEEPSANTRNLDAVAKVLGVTPQWLMYGEGSDQQLDNMLTLTPKEHSTFTQATGRAQRIEPEILHGLRFIRAIDMTAQASKHPQVTEADPICEIPVLPEMLRPLTSSRNEMLLFVKVHGDAMAPTLREGDFALVDLRQRNMDIDGLFLLPAGDALQIRRISRDPRTGFYRIRPDNENYETYEADPKSFIVYGRIVWMMRRP